MVANLKITVVTVSYNAEATIADTLRSVAAQQDADCEHLIIDGGSNDATLRILEEHARPGLRVISEPDKGLYDAMNKGMRLATGEVVGFLNGDDFFCRTDALAQIAAEFAAGDCDAVSAGVVIVDPEATDRVVRGYGARHFRPWMLRFTHMPPHPGFYARRTAALQVGAFNQAYGVAADFDWLMRFYLVHRLRVRSSGVTTVAMRAGGVSQQGLSSWSRNLRDSGAALRASGFAMPSPLLWLKYSVKIGQLISRPRDFPAPAPVRWAPAG